MDSFELGCEIRIFLELLYIDLGVTAAHLLGTKCQTHCQTNQGYSPVD